ncbi:MAG: hypothetical protein ACK40G_03680 [Cytophagaceae bacterium]
MTNNFYNQDNIDSFLSGKLKGEEKAFFEEAMSKDPLIKNEIQLQKDIIDGLKNARKAELKARLNNIEVVGTGSSFINNAAILKFAASVVITAVVGTSIYYFTRTHEPQVVVDTNIETNKSDLVTDNVEMVAEEKPVSIINNQDVTTQKAVKKASKERNVSSKAPKVKTEELVLNNESTRETVTLKKRTVFPSVNEPKIAESFGDEGDVKSDNTSKVVNAEITHRDENKLDNLSVKILASRKNKEFHYQHYNNKLFLYGDFNSKPYEILELNTSQGRELFLFFDSSYYELKPNQLEISPLKEILDKSIVRELERLKK